jgi:predicted RNase H-like HicB family nuclease
MNGRAMAGRTYHAIIEKDEDGTLGGVVPELQGGHTQAPSLGELKAGIKEAIEAYLDSVRPTYPGPEFVEVQTTPV